VRLVSAAIILASIPGALDAQPVSRHRAWFPDGTGLEIYSETTGSTQSRSVALIGIGPGRSASQDLVNRVIVDKQNNILFAYNIEASRGERADTVLIRIEPISAATETGMLKWHESSPQAPTFFGAHLPTVAAVREFPSVKIGEVVTLDILYNPSTGEKVYDVLRPITDVSPTPSGPVVTGNPDRETISLKEISLELNGKAIHAPVSWMIGSAARIDIPGHGAYVFAAYDPRNANPGYPFQAIAQADGKTLSWTIDRDRVVIASTTRVLTQNVKGVLWVYHERPDPSQAQHHAVQLQTADTVQWLLRKK